MNHSWPAVALLGFVASHAWAADAACSTSVEATDAMQYSTRAIEIPKTCKQFSVTLKHLGSMQKTAMGHNWVLSRSQDEQGINSDGAQAGLDKNYLKAGDSRVLAHTKIIGGGESDSTTFSVSVLKANETYVFFCSFPGHVALMKGTVSLAQ